MKKTLQLLLLVFSVVWASQTSAQVTSVNYQMKYDTSTCLYDCYIIINAGSAVTPQQRTQFNAQYSIVVPNGVTITVDTSYMPLKTTDNTPMDWSISSTLIDSFDYDFYSITPTLSPTSRYDTLSSGDTVKIFSLSVSSITSCSDSIRIWENGVDPPSSDPKTGGSDFSNGFTMGGVAQLYNANSTQLFPPAPTIISAVTTCTGGIEIDLTATTSTCQEPLTYAWTGPNSYTSTSEDVNIFPATSINNGDYKVTITDAFGCQDSLTITATGKPSAGADHTVCAGVIDTLSGADPSTGTWTQAAGNPAGASLGPLPGGQVAVTYTPSAGGTYNFVYSIPGCKDTVAVTVNAKPTAVITGSNNICIGETTTLSPSTGGTWVSNNTSVATVTNGGIVTAVGQGTATFTFTSSSTGCFATTGPVTVNPQPTVAVTGTDAVCIGSTTTLTPNSGGTWSSDDVGIATVTNAGVVTGVSAGIATLTFTETSTNCSNSLTVEVKAKPIVSNTGQDSICVLGTTQLSPNTGGTWASSDPQVATVNNSGLVTGLKAGFITAVFTETATGCSSDPTDTIWVVPAPTVSITGNTNICISGTTTLSPTTGGTWVSNNTSVATVTNAGVVTAVAQGSATFTFTNTATGCSATTPAVIVDPKPTVSTSSPNICIGSSATLSPSSGGTWSAVNPGIASLSGGNVATGVSSGTAGFIFSETSTGCLSDTLFITVEPRPVVSITGADDICVGFTTQLSPNSGGTWQSSNPSIATVSNSGLVTGVGPGTVTFTFTSSTTLCSSDPTDPVTVRNKPVVSVTGPTDICVGATTTLTPTSGGTWSSSNTSVATVTNAGVVTGVGPGSATFTFTDSSTGCVSSATEPITVTEPPSVSFTGPSTICVDFTTTLSPTAGGTWTSSDPAVATVTNAGLVTGIAAGTASLTFTETGSGCPSSPLTVTIEAKPIVNVTGDTDICIGETTTLSPTTGGVWTSSDNNIATVTNAGVVTGVAQGTVTFTFTNAAGCKSDPTSAITVNDPPTVTITGDTQICIGDTSQLAPATGGLWTSSDTLVATVTDAGVVTGITAGSVTFTFQDTVTNCASGETGVLTVDPKPTTVINGPSSICVGATTNISPTIGGTWSSSNPAVATINNAGIITGVSPGTANFTFTNSSTGCVSDASGPVTVTEGPTVTISGDTEICIGETTTLTPTTGGTWQSSNTGVATVTNAGVVTGVGAGSVTFEFTETATGCKSLPTDAVTVHPAPTVSITGNPNICIGSTTQLSPTSGGTWASNNPSIATVDNNGLVTGVASGNVTFTFTDSTTGCPSEDTEPVNVSASPVAVITGLTTICVSQQTTLSPSSGGTWSSSDPTIATVTNGGIVTSHAPGKVTFSFIETLTGCASASDTDTLTVVQCTDPDFNATFVDVPVNGDVSTNDQVAGGTTYGPTPVLQSSPSGSVESITVNSDGTYTFTANTVGVYVYDVPVCVPPLASGCPTSLLTITVVDFLEPDLRPIANTDIGTTPVNTPITLISLENDDCVVVTGCSLDATSVTITDPPRNGGVTVNGLNGNTTYTPGAGFIGIDTLTYQVCVTGEPANCATALQIITVNSSSADNTTQAADDFASTGQATPVSGNVSTNDTDPEGDTQTVTPQNITVAAGTLSLDAAGAYTFTPAAGFFGPVDFPYTTCDDNTSVACADATLHILVVKDLTIKVRVYLEGALLNNGNAVGSTHTRPLMRDNLRSSTFTGSNYIPSDDPYQFTSEFITHLGTLYDHVGPGDDTEFANIPDPSSVFAVTGENAVTDWVFVELRDKSDSTTVIATRSGLVQRDGDVGDLDGIFGLRFPGIAVDDYYVVVRHRNHLGAMTAAAKTPTQLATLVDFTKVSTGIWDFGTTKGNGYDYTGLAMNPNVKPGYLALWGGDFDGNKKVKADNPNDDLNTLVGDVFFYRFGQPGGNTTGNLNFDFAYGYLSGDYDMNGKAKYDNPNDDKNMLYGQLLFYPLNAQLLSNFDFFIQQIPE